MNQPERHLQQQICTYLKMQFPDVIFMSECSGLKVSIGVARQLKAIRSGKSLPDLFIAEARQGMHGLFIELKAETVFLKNGELSKEKHIQEQSEVLKRLIEKDYYACWGIGFDKTKTIIDNYLKNE